MDQSAFEQYTDDLAWIVGLALKQRPAVPAFEDACIRSNLQILNRLLPNCEFIYDSNTYTVNINIDPIDGFHGHLVTKVVNVQGLR
jgi:hypothetical protein